jgi:signal transduction histidine kinase/DNA-binding response OmpR family regulator
MKSSENILILLILIPVYSFAYGSNQDYAQIIKQKFIDSKNDSALNSSVRTDALTMVNSMEKEKALAFWNDLIKNCKEAGYHWGAGFCYYNLAIRLSSEGEYFQSYLAFQESRNAYTSINDNYGIARVYNGLGNLFTVLYKFDRALGSYYESARIFKTLDDPVYGIIYLNIGGILVQLDSLKAAKSYLEESRTILTNKRDTSGLINCFINLSEVFLAEKKPDSALFYLTKSNDLLIGNIDIDDKFNAMLNLGRFYMMEGNTDQAEPLLTEAYLIAENEKYSIPVERKANAIKAFSELNDLMGDAETAYNLVKRYLEYETESKRVQSNLDLSRIEFESLERERLLEHRKRTFTMYTSIILLLSSLLVIFTYYRSYRHKKRANQLLTEMDGLKTQLYSNITHEFRTPLTLILGPLEQMLSSDSDGNANRKQVKSMRKNARSLLNLVNEMLDLAKIDAKSLKLEIQQGDIARFIRTRFAAFASLAEQKQINFQIRVSEKTYITHFDASKLEKIINNLVSNAIKFTPKSGFIHCTANFNQNKKNSVEIIVGNSGKGIPANELNKIFDRFHQAENTETYTSPGTGIGLSLTHELVVLMHGTIDAESEPGMETRFRVIIPLGIDHLKYDEFKLVKKNIHAIHDEEFSADKAKEPSSENDYPKKSDATLPQVLVVDDQVEIREFIEEYLTDSFSLQLAADGNTAYEIAVDNIPDLVVTDLAMPEMDGTELCRKLKTDERTSHIPVIILTGKSGIKDKLKGLETGADAYLTKPFNISELKLRITKLIEQRKKLRERFTRNLNIEPKDIAVTSADEKFLLRALEVIEKNMGNSDFEVTQLQEELLMSRTQLFRKIKAMTNQTPGEFIRTIRLKRAARLLVQNYGNVAQITYEVGFNNPSYFAKCFRELYGKLPSEYQKKS